MAGGAEGQSIHRVRVSIQLEDATLMTIFSAIEQQTKFLFMYDELVKEDPQTFTLDHRDTSVADILTGLSRQTAYEFRQLNRNISVAEKKKDLPDKISPMSNKQERTITGKVTNENGEPLAGATIQVKGKPGIGTVTDIEGNYAISIPDDAITLIFSFIGFKSQEIDITTRTSVEVMLFADLTALEEVSVVSTGYYEVERQFNTGNIGKIDAKIIERQPVVNPLEALQGQVAGVFIQQTSGIPGSEININIRGLNSMNNGQIIDNQILPNANQPFFVIDGVPFMSSSLNHPSLNLANGNPLTALRPSDIESIEVLKDADATAIYGSRGANGVILITTKKGQSGKAKLDLDISRGVGRVGNKVDLLSTPQYLEMRREAVFNDGGVLSATDSLRLSDLFLWDQNRYTDWQEELLGGTAEQTNASVAITGGSETTSFLFSSSLSRQTNVIPYDDSRLQSVSGHFNVNHTSKDSRFNANFSTTYTVNNNRQPGGTDVSAAYLLPPNAPALFDEEGDINWSDNFENPLASLERFYENSTKNLVANATLSYELIKDLTLRTTIGYNNVTVDEIRTRPISSLNPTGSGFFSFEGRNATGDAFEESWIVEPQLQLVKAVGPGELNVLIGSTFQATERERLDLEALGYSTDLLIRDLFAAPSISVASNSFSEYRYNAIYARFNYNLKNRYVLNLTGRRDGSSRFGPGNQFGNFGAVGAAWVFSNENFISETIPFLSFGKLRGSYGLTGNDQILDYQYLNSFSLIENYGDNLAIVPSRAANEDYSWETNKKLEFGLELGFLENRITINTSWFRNRSSNQLIGRPLSEITGFASVQFNLPAIVENRGIEIEFNSINIQSDDFTWTTGINFTRARNELVEFPNIEQFSGFDNTFEVGRSIFGRKEYQSLGVNPETGIYEFVDFDENGRIGQEDRQNFMEIFQDFYGGINNSFSWKGFRLDLFFRFVKQNARNPLAEYPRTPGDEMSLRNYGLNFPVEVLERWQNYGEITSIQKFSRESALNTTHRIYYRNSDSQLVDGSFIRLQNVAISWNIPSGWLSVARLEAARIYIQGQNLLTLTPYKGVDPETQSLALPPLRLITTGIQLTI